MKSIPSIHRKLLSIFIFITPLVFTSVVAEYFVTAKAYTLHTFAIVSILLLVVHLFRTKRLILLQAPLLGALCLLLVSRLISLFFSTPNWYQALFLPASGIFTFVSLFILYTIVMYFDSEHHDESHETRQSLVLLTPLMYGVAGASLLYVFFSLNLLKNVQLPENLLYLKGSFSTLGGAVDMLTISVLVLVATGFSLFTTISAKAYHLATRHLALLAVVGTAVTMIAVMIFTSQQSLLQLPPHANTWSATVETLKSPRTAAIGAGIDSFESLFTAVKTREYNQSETWNINFLVASSGLLQLWIESGLLGLASIVILVLASRRLLLNLKKAKHPQAHLLYIIGVLLAIAWVALPWSYMILFMTFVYFLELSILTSRGAHSNGIFSRQSLEKGLRGIPGFQSLNATLMPSSQSIDLAHHSILNIVLLVALVGISAGGSYALYKVGRAEILFKQSIDAMLLNDAKGAYDNLRAAVVLYPQNEKFRAQFAQLNILLANNIARKATSGAGETGAEDGKTGSTKGKGAELSAQERQVATQFIQQAISEAKALVALNPTKASSWNMLAVIYRNIIQVAEGAQAWTIASYEEALRRDPLNPQLLVNLGGVYYGAQDYPAAIESFQRAVIAKPNWANAHYNLAWGLYQAKDYERAVTSMRNVTQLLAPTSPDLKVARENLKLFEDKLAEFAKQNGGKSGAGAGGGSGAGGADGADKNAAEPNISAASGTDTLPIEQPASPEAVLSPGLELDVRDK